MINANRFREENLTKYDLHKEVWVECSNCSKKAIAKVDFEIKLAIFIVVNCGFNKKNNPTCK